MLYNRQDETRVQFAGGLPAARLTGPTTPARLSGFEVMESYRVENVGTVKLGRIKPSAPPLVPRFAQYATVAMPAPPEAADLKSGSIAWPMYANDRYGCCVFSCIGHEVGLWSAIGNPPEKLFEDEAILRMYSEVTGFNPADPNSDRGAMIADALRYLCQPGKGLDGNTSAAFVSVGTGEGTIRAKQALWLFGGLHLGISLPIAWQRNTGPGRTWDVGNGPAFEPGTWGGHAVLAVAYDREALQVVTWGKLQRLTWRALARYCDEAYAVIDWDWAAGTTTPPHGFDLAALLKDWAELGGAPVTPPDPPTPNPPPGGGHVVVDLDARRVDLPPGWTSSGGS